MTKEREEEVEELEPTEGTPEDEQQEISTKEQDGEHVVEVQRETRKQRRERESAERTRKLIEEAQKPLMDQIALLAQQRQAPVQQQFVQPQAPVQNGDDDPAYDRLVEEQARIVRLVKASTDPEEIGRLEKEWHRNERKKNTLIAEKAASSVHDQFRRENPPQEDPVHRLARIEFADVLAYGPDATNYAGALFTQEKIKAFRERRPFDEMATHRAVLKKTAEDFGLRQKELPPRNPAQQRRFATPGSTSTGSGTNPGPGRALTKAEKSMAIAWAGAGVPEKKAYDEWAKMMGPDYFADT